MAKGVFTFEDLDKAMSKVDPLGSVITENEFSKINEWIGTGNYLLNAQISGSLFKGVPANRGVVFAGESGTGKTFLTLNVVREAQKMGYFVIYGDSEAAVDEDLLVKFGVDPNKVRYQPLKTALHTRHFVSNLCATLREQKKKGMEVPKIMFIIDSLGNLATEKEIGDALSGSDKRDMTKQQNLRSMFRVITTDLAEFKIPLIMTNHTYAAVGSYVPMQIVSGGGGAIYNASIILTLTKAGLKAENTAEAEEAAGSKMGIIVTSKPFKNRFAKPIPIKFHISFFKGMNPYVGLENFVSWESCGIGKGKLVEEIIETPIFEEDGVTPKMFRGKQKIERTKTGNYAFEPDPSGKTFAVKHLGKTIKGSAVFSSEVFTEEILKQLDEEVIKPMFELPKVVQEEEDLAEAFGLEDDDLTAENESENED
jgi:RecA/RadA recombinase